MSSPCDLLKQHETTITHAAIPTVLELLSDMLTWIDKQKPGVVSRPNTAEDAQQVLAMGTLFHKVYLRAQQLLVNLPARSKSVIEHGIASFLEVTQQPSTFWPSVRQARRIQEAVGEALLLDAGAGSGFVANLLSCIGVRVVAVDTLVLSSDREFHGKSCPVLQQCMVDALRERKALIHDDQVVLGLFSPHPLSDIALRALIYFHTHGGKRLLTSGRPIVNATPAFWAYVRQHYVLQDTINNIRVCSWVPKGTNPLVAMPLFVYVRKELHIAKSNIDASSSSSSLLPHLQSDGPSAAAEATGKGMG